MIFATLKTRVRLNEHSDKETYHITLASDLTYQVGDCIAVYPKNDPALVEAILAHFHSDGSEEVLDRNSESSSFCHFLEAKANLIRSPKKLGDKEHVLASLQERPDLDIPTFCSLLSPLLPRFYSIASAQEVVGQEIHLLVTVNENPPHFPTKYGTCSHYLCHRAEIGEEIPIYLQKAKDFYLSPDSFQKPIIMVGPGTGLAPFRGFLQKRLRAGAKDNWLFFGERREKNDYYFREEWEAAISQGALKIDTAFSRDKERVYVQDQMEKKGKELWDWLEKGAYFYVCGDAKKMAKAVDQTLHSIIEREGQCDPKTYIKNLKSQKRYLRDVY